jgi:predicted GNAT family acetyltransferase
MPDGSQLLINTETFFISEREGQGIGEELVREKLVREELVREEKS